LVSGLSAELASVIGDYSAGTRIERYQLGGGRPMPTVMEASSLAALRMRLAIGYAGTRIGWSPRTGRLSLLHFLPSDLELTYDGQDTAEPMIIRHHALRHIGGRSVEVVETYDLTDLDAPRYTITREGGDEQDLTAAVLGEVPASGWFDEWRWEDGRPFHPIVVTGDNHEPYSTNDLVEGTLIMCVRWTALGRGLDDAGWPQRNVRGMHVPALDSDTDTGESGAAIGPESVVVWVDDDHDTPGTHWQDEPGYDPLAVARTLRIMEAAMLSNLGIQVDLEATGGEPTKTEQEATEAVIVRTLAECRRYDGEVIARCAAVANRLPEVDGEGFDETAPGILYREEITDALPLEPDDPQQPKPTTGAETP